MTREEAIEVYNGLINEKIKEAFEFFAPELAESEDERIRKEIIGYLNSRVATAEETELLYFKRWLAYLEKQKENPKSAYSIPSDCVSDAKNENEHNESGDFVFELRQIISRHWYADEFSYRVDDEEGMASEIMSLCEKQKEQKPTNSEKPKEWIDLVAKEMFIKALERAVEQTKSGYELTDCDKHSWWEDFKACSGIKPAEWSEEDKKFIKELCDLLASIAKNNYVGRYYATDLVNKLQSLRPQPHTVSTKDATKFGNLEYERGVKDGIQSEKSRHWKPSEEQMKALISKLPIINGTGDKVDSILESLYNDLKKLI